MCSRDARNCVGLLDLKKKQKFSRLFVRILLPVLFSLLLSILFSVFFSTRDFGCHLSFLVLATLFQRNSISRSHSSLTFTFFSCFLMKNSSFRLRTRVLLFIPNLTILCYKLIFVYIERMSFQLQVPLGRDLLLDGCRLYMAVDAIRIVASVMFSI